MTTADAAPTEYETAITDHRPLTTDVVTWIAMVALLCVARGSALADIFEWRDAQGVRHFTNIAEDIPAEFRSDTKIVARERGEVVAASAPRQGHADGATSPPQQAQVVYDQRRLASVYQAGVDRGLREAQRASARAAKPVQVVAPLAIASVPARPAYFPYLPPPCERPFLANGFDQGRLRYQTWRLHLDDCRSPLWYGPVPGALDPRFLPLRIVPRNRR